MNQTRKGIVASYPGSGEYVSVVIAPSTVAETVIKCAHYTTPAAGDRVLVNVGDVTYIIGKIG